MAEETGRTVQQSVWKPGTTVLSEGERKDIIFLITDGSVALHRNGVKLCELGPGAIVGGVSTLLEREQLFTVVATGQPISMAKAYQAHDLAHFFTIEPMLVLNAFHSIETEFAEIEKRAVLKALAGEQDAAARAKLWTGRRDILAKELAGATGDMALHADAGALGGAWAARVTAHELAEPVTLDLLLAQRTLLRALAFSRQLQAIEGIRERVGRAREVLRERAEAVAQESAKVS